MVPWAGRGCTWILTNEAPISRFGFYSAGHDALIMNIRTGGGTLVHELVHPYVEENVPNCPAWINEGLGSLYEAVGWPRGQMRGYVNWRLPDLQVALRGGAVPSFEWLTGQSEQDFYGADPGTNYSQSRYLVYYLQERGLLQPFYRRFLARRRQDPTGYPRGLEHRSGSHSGARHASDRRLELLACPLWGPGRDGRRGCAGLGVGGCHRVGPAGAAAAALGGIGSGIDVA